MNRARRLMHSSVSAFTSSMQYLELMTVEVRLYDPDTMQGVGPLDWFDLDTSSRLNLEMIEKWWCLGDTRNRAGMWVQGRAIGSWKAQ